MSAFADWHLLQQGVREDNLHHSSFDKDRANYQFRAQMLLKGCEVHWGRSIKMICSSAVLIDPSKTTRFRDLAEQLRTGASVEQARLTEATIRQEFPQIKAWLNWWMRPSNASKIFQAFKTMDPALDQSLPDTTNAVESLHNVLGVSIGQGHQIIDGLVALHQWVTRYELENEARLGMGYLWRAQENSTEMCLSD